MHIVLMPHSITNPTSQYRVAEYDSWIMHARGDAPLYTTVSSWATFAEAQEARDKLNNGQEKA